MSIWFLLTNAAFDWMQEVHAKGYHEISMFPSCVDEHHFTVCVIPKRIGRAWAIWTDSAPDSLRDISTVY